MNVKSKIIATSLIISTTFLGFLAQKMYVYYREKEQQRQFILNESRKLLPKCVGSIEQRRGCDRQKLLAIRHKENPPVKILRVSGGKYVSVESEDLGDVVRFKRPSAEGSSSCEGSSYFLDWDENWVYASLENPYFYFKCMGTDYKYISAYDKEASKVLSKLKPGEMGGVGK